MRIRRAVLVACIAVLSAAVPVFAHHSLQAEYNVNMPITLKGTVTKVAWNNPHVHLFMDVKDNSNEVMIWELTLGSPNSQFLKGWKIDTLRPGDHITVTAYPARAGANMGYAQKITITPP